MSWSDRLLAIPTIDGCDLAPDAYSLRAASMYLAFCPAIIGT
ncbi:Uncharacterised protein [Mycobacteroides abscessus subsp. abscessus]|nr:Uncharacterised protein [Mycobacteroides abscessus subsp. abscessus]